jgi:hypothetical protein
MIKVLRAAFLLACVGAIALALDALPTTSVIREFGLTAMMLVGAVALIAIAFWE